VTSSAAIAKDMADYIILVGMPHMLEFIQFIYTTNRSSGQLCSIPASLGGIKCLGDKCRSISRLESNSGVVIEVTDSIEQSAVRCSVVVLGVKAARIIARIAYFVEAIVWTDIVEAGL
jgi:hypothetical protein